MLLPLILLIPFSVLLWGFFVDMIARFRSESSEDAIEDGRDFRFTVLIPAHNEQACIYGVLEALRRQTYRNFEVYVIDDCCTDDTEKVVSGFPEVKILKKTVKSACKGDVLNYALDKLDQELGDVVTVVDADCTVNPLFLEKLNGRYKSGAKAVMPDTDTWNPYKSIVTAWYTVYWKMVSEMSRKAHAKLKLSGNLCGCGMSFRRENLRRTVTITEDVEYFMILGSEGIQIDYAGEAKVYQEQPQTFKDMLIQLRRWMSGVRSVNRIYFMPYIRSLFREFSVLKLDALMTAQTCSAYAALIAMALIMLAVGHLFLPAMLPGLGVLFLFFWLVTMSVGLTVTRRCRLNDRIMIAAAPTYCLFLLTMGLIYIYSIIRPEKTWRKVERDERNG